MRRSLVIIVSLVFLVGLVSVAVSAPPAGKVTISAGGTKDAVFDHPAHVKREANCQACHHKDAAGKEQKCTGCHTKEGKDKATPAKEMFHKKCGECHKKEAKGPQYPKDCKICHVAAAQ